MKTFKNLLFLLFFVSNAAGCAQIEVLSVDKLTLPEPGKFYHPRFDESGRYILLTGDNYKGLLLYDLDTKALRKISDADGAGYSPVILKNAGTVLFTENEFIHNRRYTKLNAWHAENGLTELIVPPARSLSVPGASGDRVFIKADDQLKTAVMGQGTTVRPQKILTGIEDRKLIVYGENETKMLDPYKGESYIWPSVSPDGNRILAYAMEKGAFICDKEGKIVAEFGNIEAPVWAGNNYIAGMVTQDDGHQVIKSVIVMAEISSGMKKEMSPAGLIAMYPSISAGNDKLVFQSPTGDIYLLRYHVRQ